ncbi:MAG: hypothetical protein AB7I30_03050 [Isosphaeraceae bacterium]
MERESTPRTTTRLDPQIAWKEMTEAPLKGLGLAREAGTVLAWDVTDRLYLLDLQGGCRVTRQSPGKISLAVISDDGSRIALVGQGATLWLLDGDLNPVSERQGPPEPIALAIDPHGRFVLVTSRLGSCHFYNRAGRPAGRFESTQPLAHVLFVADRPFLIGAAAYGMLAGFDLETRSGGKLDAEAVWVDKQVSSIGRLTASGDGSVILATCFTHGVQRYDLQGDNDGAYHLGGTAQHAVPDFAGRIIAVSTLEGELSLINPAGNVRWKTTLPRPAVALEVDPLGRFLIHGNETGEIVRLDLYASDRPRHDSGSGRTSIGTGSGSGGGIIREPNWTLPVVTTDEQAESAVLAVLDEPPRLALFASKQRLQLFTTAGRNLGFAPEILGGGRILRTSPGWLAAATDRQILVYQGARNAARRIDLSLVEVTHLAIRPDSFGLAIVQERDRVGRATLAGRWIWKEELRSAIEDVAIGPDGFCAWSDDQGRLDVRDPAGKPAGTYQTDPAEPLSLIEAVDDAPPGLAWMSLARRSQVLRGHDLPGRVLWESPVAWEGWQFQKLGPLALISAPDGRVQAFDGSGHLRGQGQASTSAQDLFSVSRGGEPRRISRRDVHLICADLEGRVRWRAVCDEPVGPFAVGHLGVAALIGRSIAWFDGLD